MGIMDSQLKKNIEDATEIGAIEGFVGVQIMGYGAGSGNPFVRYCWGKPAGPRVYYAARVSKSSWGPDSCPGTQCCNDP